MAQLNWSISKHGSFVGICCINMNVNISMKTINRTPGEPNRTLFLLSWRSNSSACSSLLLISSTHLYILRKLPEHKTMANLVSRRPLHTITKITSKKNFPEIITFRYTLPSDRDEDDDQEKSIKSKQKQTKPPAVPGPCDKVHLFDAGDATKNIKILIMKALNMFDDPTITPSS